MSCLLTESLPKSVWVDGREYGVRWAYQYGIMMERALRDEGLSEEDRLWVALSIFYEGELPGDVGAAVAAMGKFLVRERRMNEAQKRAAARFAEALPLYCYEQDDEYIFAAFMGQYGINLAREKGLHWHEFCALFNGLDECVFTRIKGWRGADLGRIKDAGERRRAAEIKAFWALPEGEEARRRLEALEKALMEDGRIAGVL